MTGNGSSASPYIVSTWEEFKSVCKETKFVKFADGGGIIDFSQEYSDGLNERITLNASVDGNGWEFKNLSISVQVLASFNIYNRISNLRFTDIVSSGARTPLSLSQQSSFQYCYGHFENCTFQGNLNGTSQLVANSISYKSMNIFFGCDFKLKFSGNNPKICTENSHATNCIFDIDTSEVTANAQNILGELKLQNCYIKGALNGLEIKGDSAQTGTLARFQTGYTIVDADSTEEITADEFTEKVLVNSSRAAIGEGVIGVSEEQLKDKNFLTSDSVDFPIGNGNPRIIFFTDDIINAGTFDLQTGGTSQIANTWQTDWIPINLDESGDSVITFLDKPGIAAAYKCLYWGFILKRADSSIVIPENNGWRKCSDSAVLGAEYADCTAIKITYMDKQSSQYVYGRFALYVGKLWLINRSYNNSLPYTVFMTPEYTPPSNPEHKPIGELNREYITIYSQDTSQDGFDTHGLGVLSPTKCEITEELNGKWELSIEHPVDSYGKWEYIRPFAIIKALGQLFTIRIADVKWSGNKGMVSAKADHIFYQLNDAWIHPGNILLSSRHAIGIINHIAGITDRQIREGHVYYDFTWDIPADLMVTENFYDNWSSLSSGATFAEFVMGSNGLIIGTSGEIYRDNFYFSIRERLEKSNYQAFDIRVGKNLRGIKRTIDTTRLCTYFLGFDDLGNEYAVAYESFPLISPPHYVVRSQKYSYNIDDSLPLEERVAKSKKLLENDVNLFFNTNCIPKISYEVDLEDVRNNPDYADFKEESDYRVGNVGVVHDDRLGGEIILKITKTIRNAITGKTISVTFGDNIESTLLGTSRSAIIHKREGE